MGSRETMLLFSIKAQNTSLTSNRITSGPIIFVQINPCVILMHSMTCDATHNAQERVMYLDRGRLTRADLRYLCLFGTVPASATLRRDKAEAL